MHTFQSMKFLTALGMFISYIDVRFQNWFPSTFVDCRIWDIYHNIQTLGELPTYCRTELSMMKCIFPLIALFNIWLNSTISLLLHHAFFVFKWNLFVTYSQNVIISLALAAGSSASHRKHFRIHIFSISWMYHPGRDNLLYVFRIRPPYCCKSYKIL